MKVITFNEEHPNPHVGESDPDAFFRPLPALMRAAGPPRKTIGCCAQLGASEAEQRSVSEQQVLSGSRGGTPATGMIPPGAPNPMNNGRNSSSSATSGDLVLVVDSREQSPQASGAAVSTSPSTPNKSERRAQMRVRDSRATDEVFGGVASDLLEIAESSNRKLEEKGAAFGPKKSGDGPLALGRGKEVIVELDEGKKKGHLLTASALAELPDGEDRKGWSLNNLINNVAPVLEQTDSEMSSMGGSAGGQHGGRMLNQRRTATGQQGAGRRGSVGGTGAVNARRRSTDAPMPPVVGGKSSSTVTRKKLWKEDFFGPEAEARGRTSVVSVGKKKSVVKREWTGMGPREESPAGRKSAVVSRTLLEDDEEEMASRDLRNGGRASAGSAVAKGMEAARPGTTGGIAMRKSLKYAPVLEDLMIEEDSRPGTAPVRGAGPRRVSIAVEETSKEMGRGENSTDSAQTFSNSGSLKKLFSGGGSGSTKQMMSKNERDERIMNTYTRQGSSSGPPKKKSSKLPQLSAPDGRPDEVAEDGPPDERTLARDMLGLRPHSTEPPRREQFHLQRAADEHRKLKQLRPYGPEDVDAASDNSTNALLGRTANALVRLGEDLYLEPAGRENMQKRWQKVAHDSTKLLGAVAGGSAPAGTTNRTVTVKEKRFQKLRKRNAAGGPNDAAPWFSAEGSQRKGG